MELSRDRKSCHRSRHVDRRYFKVRELASEGQLHVEDIDTKLNQLLGWMVLTNQAALPIESFTRHRARLLNLTVWILLPVCCFVVVVGLWVGGVEGGVAVL